MSKNKSEERCIFCMKNEADGEKYKLTNEHIISECIGGWITIPYVCKHCNDLFGSRFESLLKQNAYIVSAIDKLGVQPPEKAYNRANIKLDFDDGTIAVGKLTSNHEVGFFPTKQDDGSLIVPECDSKTVLIKQVSRFEKAKKVKVNYDSGSFDSAPYNRIIRIPDTDISYIKKREISATTIFSNLTEPISFMIPATIAFETLAGFSRQFIDHSSFDPFRQWVLNDDLINKVLINTLFYHVKDPNDLNYRPYHVVRYSRIENSLVALVVLFGQITFSVFMAFEPDWSLLPSEDLLDIYLIYDIRKKELYPKKAPGQIFDEGTMYLKGVYDLANYELRIKSNLE